MEAGRQRRLFGKDAGTWGLKTHAWSKLSPVTSPPARSAPVMVYEPSRKRVMLVGGGEQTDQWELDLSVPTWISTGSSPGRPIAGGAVHELTRTLVMFGGVATFGWRDDTWQFQYRSDTPDEVCTGAVDDDGDGAVDCNDPDCTAACP